MLPDTMTNSVNFYTAGSDYLVFLGFQTAQDLLNIADRFNPAGIIVVEHDENKITALDSMLENDTSLQKRLFIYSDIAAPNLIERLKDSTTSVCFSPAYFSLTTLAQVCEQWAVEHICGEINTLEYDALDVYRICGPHVDSFYWAMADKSEPLVGKRTLQDVDVSVIVPVYNISAYIDKCITSLLSQTLENIEILLIDDGSTDCSATIIDEWQKQHPHKIRVIHKENGGCASARNLGLRSAKGNYIGFVDGDDWVEPDMFYDLFRAAIIKNAQIAQGGYKEVYEGGEVVEFPLNVNLTRLNMLHERPTIWRRIYAKNFLLEHKISFPEHIKRFDDLPFQFEAIFHSSSVCSIAKCYYNYRQGRIGQDIAIKDERLFVHFDIFELIFSKYGELFNYNEEVSFFKLEFDAHYWATCIIEKKIRKNYMTNAAKQMLKFRFSLEFVRMLKIAIRNRKLFFFLNLMLMR